MVSCAAVLLLLFLLPLPASAGGELALLRGPSGSVQVQRANRPLLLAGDTRGVWLAVPRVVETDRRWDFFELWEHLRNASDKQQRPRWQVASEEGRRLFADSPRALAVVPGKAYDPSRNAEVDVLTAYVVIERDTGERTIRGYSIDHANEPVFLPDLQVATCAAGSRSRIFVLARGGVRVAATTAASAPATRPAAAATRVVPDHAWNLWCFQDQKWKAFPTLGLMAARGPETPSREARPVLAYAPGEIYAAWVEPATPSRLHVRKLTYPTRKADTQPAAEAQPSGWSPVNISETGESITRLMQATLGGEQLVFWPVKTSGKYELHGGKITSDGAFAAHPLFPVALGEIAEPGFSPETDIAAAPCGTGLMVVAGREKFRSWMLGVAGAPVGPQPLEPAERLRPESPVLQNVLLIVVMALLAFSLWQWRLRPRNLDLPRGYSPGLLRQRLAAAVIDLALPFVAVLGYATLARGEDTSSLLGDWYAAMNNPLQAALQHPEILWIFVGYLGHCTLGELLTGQSIGKALVGLRVVSMEGARAPAASVLVRNLVKIPEFATLVLLAYVLISEHRQRFGDLLARTLVVNAKPADEERSAAERREDPVDIEK